MYQEKAKRYEEKVSNLFLFFKTILSICLVRPLFVCVFRALKITEGARDLLIEKTLSTLACGACVVQMDLFRKFTVIINANKD